jgi:two-component sensor histidine kinase
LERDVVQKQILFTISDNGKGMPVALDKKGLGLRLIDIFSRQMGGEYQSYNDNGLSYQFKIPFEADEQ